MAGWIRFGFAPHAALAREGCGWDVLRDAQAVCADRRQLECRACSHESDGGGISRVNGCGTRAIAEGRLPQRARLGANPFMIFLLRRYVKQRISRMTERQIKNYGYQ